MKEDIYCIACQCQTIINKQIKVSHNKIIDKMCGVIYTDYDINGDIKLLETNLLSLKTPKSNIQQYPSYYRNI